LVCHLEVEVNIEEFCITFSIKYIPNNLIRSSKCINAFKQCQACKDHLAKNEIKLAILGNPQMYYVYFDMV
jgi:hypothetical protein